MNNPNPLAVFHFPLDKKSFQTEEKIYQFVLDFPHYGAPLLTLIQVTSRYSSYY